MKIYFLFILLDFSIQDSCDILKLHEKSIQRGHYRDVASDSNGGFMANAREIFFFNYGEFKSPLRDKVYPKLHDTDLLGHGRCERYQSMYVKFRQIYEINTIRIRFWDNDLRIHYFKIFATFKDDSDEEQIHEGNAIGLVTINFPARFVSKIRIQSLGNSQSSNLVNGHMSIIKIQAYFFNAI